MQLQILLTFVVALICTAALSADDSASKKPIPPTENPTTTDPMKPTESPLAPLVIKRVPLVILPTKEPQARSHQKQFGWKAEDFFEDARVVELCRAVEADDLERMERAVKAGADVNARGKGDMTPLFWAFYDGKLPRFTWLLEHGADPNVHTTSDFNLPDWLSKGYSVTHLVCASQVPGYFEAVFKHGGDSNLVAKHHSGWGGSPLFSVIQHFAPDKPAKIRRLIELKADVNQLNRFQENAAQYTVIRGGQFELALILYEAGADPKNINTDGKRVDYSMARAGQGIEKSTNQKWKEDYARLAKWLAEHDLPIDKAKALVEEEDRRAQFPR